MNPKHTNKLMEVLIQLEMDMMDLKARKQSPVEIDALMTKVLQQHRSLLKNPEKDIPTRVSAAIKHLHVVAHKNNYFGVSALLAEQGWPEPQETTTASLSNPLHPHVIRRAVSRQLLTHHQPKLKAVEIQKRELTLAQIRALEKILPRKMEKERVICGRFNMTNPLDQKNLLQVTQLIQDAVLQDGHKTMRIIPNLFRKKAPKLTTNEIQALSSLLTEVLQPLILASHNEPKPF